MANLTWSKKRWTPMALGLALRMTTGLLVLIGILCLSWSAVAATFAGATFPSGFIPSSRCEDALLVKAVDNLPRWSVFERLAIEDQVLLIHKVSNQVARGATLSSDQARLVAEALRVLLHQPADQLEPFRQELDVIRKELAAH